MLSTIKKSGKEKKSNGFDPTTHVKLEVGDETLRNFAPPDPMMDCRVSCKIVRGSNGSVGLTFKRPKGCETGPFEVVNVVPAGAASFSGIKVGTFFDAVDGVNVSALTNQEVTVLVKGKPSTPLELRFCHPPTLVRKGGEEDANGTPTTPRGILKSAKVKFADQPGRSKTPEAAEVRASSEPFHPPTLVRKRKEVPSLHSSVASM